MKRFIAGHLSLVVSTMLLFQPAVTGAQTACEFPNSYLAWALGSRLSLAAVYYDRDAAAPDDTRAMIKKVTPAAEHFGMKIPQWKLKTGAPATDTANMLSYLLTTTADFKNKIAAEYGYACAMLFVVAMSSNTLLLVYVPGEPEGPTITGTIRENAALAGIPKELWMPVVEKVEANASYSDVRDAIVKMHSRIGKYLYPE